MASEAILKYFFIFNERYYKSNTLALPISYLCSVVGFEITSLGFIIYSSLLTYMILTPFYTS